VLDKFRGFDYLRVLYLQTHIANPLFLYHLPLVIHFGCGCIEIVGLSVHGEVTSMVGISFIAIVHGDKEEEL
jgi:hypothetical protein